MNGPTFHHSATISFLQGLRQRQEGLVHVSNMSKTRANSAKDLVKRSQQVWVKVISLLGQKISLSMRDVDQVRQVLGHRIRESRRFTGFRD